MCNEVEKLKNLAKYMEFLRKIHTDNCTSTKNELANKHLIAANIKISDAVMHLEKAFDILINE